VHQFQPPASRKRQEIRSEPLTFVLIFRVRPRLEVLLVEGAHQFDVHSPDCDMVELHCASGRGTREGEPASLAPSGRARPGARRPSTSPPSDSPRAMASMRTSVTAISGA